MNEADWKRLLRQIRQGYVVPVVGSQFLGGEDGQPGFQQQVALELLRVYGVAADAAPLPSFLPVSHVVARLRREAGATLQDLYTDVHDAIETVSARFDAALPPPLLQLASITDFRLFVTTTPDELLARCLRRRTAVDEVIHAPKLPTSEWHDLPADWSARAGTVPLLYLFGKSRAAPVYSIHEEDILEYAHNVISRGSQVPLNFLGALQERSLLLLGCGFPDWLGRFFLRVTNTSRLAEKSKREWMVEPPGGNGNEGLVGFLRSYSADTELLVDASPAAFVAELFARWSADRPAAAGAPPPDEPRSRAMFFISYSRGADLPQADALFAALRALGVAEHEIWLDRHQIEPGDNFRLRILDGIQGCRYFLPLLSQATDAREQGFVFREWRAANDRALDMNRAFIVPLVVDPAFEPARYDAAPVRAWSELDYGFAPGGVPDGDTRGRLVQLIREARRLGEA
jgi:TIR domain